MWNVYSANIIFNESTARYKISLKTKKKLKNLKLLQKYCEWYMMLKVNAIKNKCIQFLMLICLQTNRKSEELSASKM